MSEYQEQALAFLKEANAEMKIAKLYTVDGFPFDENDKLPHNKYLVSLSRNDDVYIFPFYGSYNDWKEDKAPTEYDVLACLEKYDVGEMADFVDEFVYVIKDRKSFLIAEKAWKACKEQYERLHEMFGDELMEKLCEIN